ncbi:MAG: hypothetical protein GX306_13035 [Clostridiales bacterium]|nr:hypothetical protein [Clostridiales bacterium]
MNMRTKNEVSNETVLLDRNQAGSIYNLGWQTLDRIASECNARITIGRRVLYHKPTLDSYFLSLTE